MKKTIKLALLSPFLFLFGFVSGAPDSTGDAKKVIPVLQLLLLNDTQTINKLVDDPATIMARKLNANNILQQANNVDTTNYVDFYKRIKDLKVFGIPDLRSSFKLGNSQTQQANKSLIKSNQQAFVTANNAAQKRVNRTYDCPSGGSASEVINLIPRGTLEADTFKTGDDYQITYYNCKIGNTTYNGSKNYHVNDFSEFDFSKVGAGDPMGEFTTTYNNYSIETSAQKTTLDGSFVYTGSASYSAVPNTAPTSLTKQFSAVAGSTITYLNKASNTETVLSYDGILEEIVYTKRLLRDNDFTYCKKAQYRITLSEGNKTSEVPVYELFCGDVAPYSTLTLWPPRHIGDVFDVGAAVEANGGRIVVFLLADGSKRYVYDSDFTGYSSISNDASVDSGQAIYNLPVTDSNLNIMEGVVVFAFEGCPGYDWIFGFLNEHNIEFTYIDINNTSAANLAGYHWFEIGLVPYIGINGNFFLNSVAESRFKLEGLIE